jgi:transcriptional regulator of arginine metabolism
MARRQRIVEILGSVQVRSQGQLEELLARDGLSITQGTLSRDLDELGAIKVRDENGTLIYSVPDASQQPFTQTGASTEDRLAFVVRELALSVVPAGNLVVVKTPPGGAHFLGSAIDLAQVDGVVGTVAGDDSVLVIAKTNAAGAQVAGYLMQLAEEG